MNWNGMNMTNNDNKKRILFVDDEPDIAFSFNIGLEDYGFMSMPSMILYYTQ